MEKQTVTFTANEQQLIKTGGIEHYASNTISYIEAIFDLGENWQEFDSVRAVWSTRYEERSEVLDTEGKCVIPPQVLTTKAVLNVNLVGSIAEGATLTDRLTTYPAYALTIDANARLGGIEGETVPASQFEQFVATVSADADRAEQAKEDARGFASDAEQSAEDAETYASNAHTSETNAHNDRIAIEADIAEVLEQIQDFEQVQVVVNGLPAGSQPTSTFIDGVLTIGIPKGDKGDTGNGISNIRKTGTSGLVDTYTITFTDGNTTTFTVTNGAKGDTGATGNGIASIEKTSTSGLVDTYTITYTNGTTTTFTVTNGEKGDTGEVSLAELEEATVVQTKSDSTPYLFRQTNKGNGCGHRAYDTIVGGTVAWNQIACDATISKTNYALSLTYDDCLLSVSGTPNTSNIEVRISMGNIGLTPNHVYLYGGASAHFGIRWQGMYTATTSARPYRIMKPTGTGITTDPVLSTTGLDTSTEYNESFPVQLFDLTLLFGSTIADYIYSLEQATAGAGVAWFKKLFPKPYYAYDAGTLKSVSGLVSHDMVGFNQWDEEAESGRYDTDNGSERADNAWTRTKNYQPCIPNTTYYVKTSIEVRFYFYDSDKNYVGKASRTNATFTTPASASYFRCTWNLTTYNHDICINLSWDGERNGEYEPYVKHSYALDSDLTLRGIPKLDASNNLYYDGDTYEADGTVTRRYGIVDLGTLEWSYTDGLFASQIQGIKKPTAYAYRNKGFMFSKTYIPDTQLTIASASMTDKSALIYTGTESMYIKDSAYSDGATFKTAMSGVYLVYELATPTTESADPYTSPQIVDDFGTEEFVLASGTFPVPVGHQTEYPMTLEDTMPNSNGTYELRVTVSGGKRSISWASV